MKKYLEKFKKPFNTRAVAALSLGALSLVVLLVAFQLNFQQRQLYTQVVRMSATGEQEIMIFRDYRDEKAEEVEKFLADCLQRNELFGDGTGEECEVYREQLECVRSSLTQQEVLSCLN